MYNGGLQSDAISTPSVMFLGDPVPTSLPRSQVVPEPELQCDVEMPANHQSFSLPGLVWHL